MYFVALSVYASYIPHHFSLLWVCVGTGTRQSAPPLPAHPGEEESCQPPAADVSQVLVGLDPGGFADPGLLCGLEHRVLSHPPEDEYKPLLQREFRLVEEGACPDAAALLAAVIYTAPPIVNFEGNPRYATPEDGMFDRFWDMTVPSLVLNVVSTLHLHQ